MVEYTCPVCGASLKDERSNINNHLVYELSEKFQSKGYKIIQLGRASESASTVAGGDAVDAYEW